MKIAMSGSTGFIGSYLRKVFAEKGWVTLPLYRSDFTGDAAALRDKLTPADAIVNLAGAPIAARWTGAYKKELYASRVPLTEKIVTAMSGLEKKPAVLISACGVGIYPSGGPFNESDSDRARDFLGRLAQDWESAALKAREIGIRAVVFRFGVVLGRGGGALSKMLPVFKRGLGGILGSGDQPVSWIHIRDLARAISEALETTSFQGAYNLAAPNPTTNKGLTRALAGALKRPAFVPVPAFALRLLFGEGASVLLSGQSVLPRRLLDAGFTFEFERIEDALADIV